MWPSPTSSRAASTPWDSTVSRWTSGMPSASRYSASATSMSSTATPMWSMVDSMERRSLAARRVHGGGGGDAQLAHPGGRRGRRVAHDPVDVPALEDLVRQQRAGQGVELHPVVVDDR